MTPKSRDHKMNLRKGKDPAPEQINIDELQKILQNIDPNGDMNQVQGSGSIFNQSELVFDRRVLIGRMIFIKSKLIFHN